MPRIQYQGFQKYGIYHLRKQMLCNSIFRITKAFQQAKNVNVTILFLDFDENPLESMNDSLEAMELIKCWFLSLEMLCTVFTRDDLSCCLFQIQFCLQWLKRCFVGLRSSASLGHWRTLCFLSSESLYLLLRHILAHYLFVVTCLPISLTFFGWLWVETTDLYTSEFIRLHLSLATSIKPMSLVHLQPCMPMS